MVKNNTPSLNELQLPVLPELSVDAGLGSDDKVFELALQAALKKLSDLAKEKLQHLDRLSHLDSEIAKLRSKLVTLASLVTVVPEGGAVAQLKEWLSELGLADAIREVLKAHDHGLTPKEVRDWLLRMGVDLSEYSNVQASIHSILKRLHESGEADKAIDKKSGKSVNVYRWSPFHPDHGAPGDSHYYEIISAETVEARKRRTMKKNAARKAARKK